MMSRLLFEWHFGVHWCAWYFCNSPCNPSGELGMSILTRCGHLRSCCFVTSTPHGTLWVSTLILRHVFVVEVSSGQNCREADLLNVLNVLNSR